MSAKKTDVKDLWIFKQIKEQLDYKFDVVELSLESDNGDDDIKIPLFGKEWSIALQISLINAIKSIISDNDNDRDIDLKAFNQWLRFALNYLNDSKQNFVNKRNPIKNVFATTEIKHNATHQSFIKSFGVKELKIFVALRDSIDEYEFILSALTFKELQIEFYRWLNKFLYDLSRPVYDIVGQDLDSAIRSKPGGDTLKVFLSSILGSPFKRIEKLPDGIKLNYGIKQVSIPYPKKVTYKEIRQACGNSSGLRWGHFVCRGIILADDNRAVREARQLVVSGNSAKTAEANYERFLKLSNGVENNRLPGENRVNYDPVRKTKMKDYLVYPKHIFIEKTAYFRFGVPDLTDSNTSKRTTTQGKKVSRRYNIPIYSENEPLDFKIAMEVLN